MDLKSRGTFIKPENKICVTKSGDIDMLNNLVNICHVMNKGQSADMIKSKSVYSKIMHPAAEALVKHQIHSLCENCVNPIKLEVRGDDTITPEEVKAKCGGSYDEYKIVAGQVLHAMLHVPEISQAVCANVWNIILMIVVSASSRIGDERHNFKSKKAADPDAVAFKLCFYAGAETDEFRKWAIDRGHDCWHYLKDDSLIALAFVLMRHPFYGVNLENLPHSEVGVAEMLGKTTKDISAEVLQQLIPVVDMAKFGSVSSIDTKGKTNSTAGGGSGDSSKITPPASKVEPSAEQQKAIEAAQKGAGYVNPVSAAVGMLFPSATSKSKDKFKPSVSPIDETKTNASGGIEESKEEAPDESVGDDKKESPEEKKRRIKADKSWLGKSGSMMELRAQNKANDTPVTILGDLTLGTEQYVRLCEFVSTPQSAHDRFPIAQAGNSVIINGNACAAAMLMMISAKQVIPNMDEFVDVLASLSTMVKQGDVPRALILSIKEAMGPAYATSTGFCSAIPDLRELVTDHKSLDQVKKSNEEHYGRGKVLAGVVKEMEASPDAIHGMIGGCLNQMSGSFFDLAKQTGGDTQGVPIVEKFELYRSADQITVERKLADLEFNTRLSKKKSDWLDKADKITFDDATMLKMLGLD